MFTLTSSEYGLNLSSNINRPKMNDVVISGTNTISDVTFTGKVLGISKLNVGLENVDNTSDINKPVSTAMQNILNNKLPINNPIFTGKCIGPEAKIDNITIKGIATINTLLFDFIKVNSNNNYILENISTNISICGNESDNIILPSEPIDGMTINISNLSENDLLIYSNKSIYNLLLAPNGVNQIPLQINFMYTFIYTENLNKIGHWYLRF